MKRALTLATGFTVGYVAGTKAGREKYEQIKGKMYEVSRQPAVVEMRENVQSQVGTATKAVADKVSGVASGVASELSKKMHSSSDDTAAASRRDAARPAPGEYPAAPTGVIPGSDL